MKIINVFNIINKQNHVIVILAFMHACMQMHYAYLINRPRVVLRFHRVL